MDRESLRKAALGFAAVTETVVYTIVGYAIGSYLDRWSDTRPWLTGLTTLLGFIGGFYRLYRVLKQTGNDDTGKDNNSA